MVVAPPKSPCLDLHGTSVLCILDEMRPATVVSYHHQSRTSNMLRTGAVSKLCSNLKSYVANEVGLNKILFSL